jgi:hypothetical protein
MLDWTADRLALKSPHFESPGLAPAIVPRERLTSTDRRQMYELLAAYFQNTSPAQFEYDLAEKDTAILLRDRDDGRIVGFSTLVKLPVTIAGRNVIGFFSGDTIISRECWGSSLLGRLWLNTVFEEKDRIGRECPETLFYWFLISSGYKTWRYLPVFFLRYLPHPELHASAFDHLVLRTLAETKFGEQYDHGAGVVRFRRANPLRPGVADITEQRRRDPMVDFFVRRNPGHAGGDELACLAPVSRSNLTAAGLRWLNAGAPA